MDHISRAEHGLLECDDLVEQKMLTASLLDLDELEELNADAGLVVLEESRNWNPSFGPLVALYEDDVVAALALGDMLATEAAKAFLDGNVAVLGDIDVLPSVEYLHQGQSDRASNNNNHASKCNQLNQVTGFPGLVPKMEVPALQVRCNFESTLVGALVDVEDIVARLKIGEFTRGSLSRLQNVGHQVHPGKLRPYRRGHHRWG